LIERESTRVDVAIHDYVPMFSPDGTRIVYTSEGIQTSNLGGDQEIYIMDVLDGAGRINLTDNGIADDDGRHTPAQT
jgi:Tol biopolymer transport system component